MLNLANAVLELKKEGDQAQRKLRELDAALKVLDSLVAPRTRFECAQTLGKRRRTMSASARKRIARAQRARWAKWRAVSRNNAKARGATSGKTEAGARCRQGRQGNGYGEDKAKHAIMPAWTTGP